MLKEDQNIYAYQRRGEENNLLILLNFSRKRVDYDLTEEVEVETAELILNNYQKEADFELSGSLRPYEARVYLC